MTPEQLQDIADRLHITPDDLIEHDDCYALAWNRYELHEFMQAYHALADHYYVRVSFDPAHLPGPALGPVFFLYIIHANLSSV